MPVGVLFLHLNRAGGSHKVYNSLTMHSNGELVSLAEEIKRVLMEHPEILVEVLTAKPEVIYEALAKLTPWQNLATKDDLKRLEEKMATKEDLKKLEEKMATKEELKRLEERVIVLRKEWRPRRI